MASIKIETGLKVYDIEDENGDVRGQISFSPTDMNFYERANTFYDNVAKHIDEVDKIVKESKEDDIAIEKMNEIDKVIKKELDDMFDAEVSDVVFGKQNCLNLLNGVTFVERFINAFLPIIKSEFAKETKKSKARIKKYTSMVEDSEK